jgi:hypothetical protein
MDPKLNIIQTIRKIPPKSPFVICALVGFVSQMIVMTLIFYPYLMFQGQLSTSNLTIRSISLTFIMGIVIPIFSAPPIANSAVRNIKKKQKKFFLSSLIIVKNLECVNYQQEVFLIYLLKLLNQHVLYGVNYPYLLELILHLLVLLYVQ